MVAMRERHSLSDSVVTAAVVVRRTARWRRSGDGKAAVGGQCLTHPANTTAGSRRRDGGRVVRFSGWVGVKEAAWVDAWVDVCVSVYVQNSPPPPPPMCTIG